MTKRIALLISLVMIFSFSCVFATESVDLLAAPEAVVTSAEVSGEASEEVSGEATPEVSGEVTPEVSGEAPAHTDTIEEEGGNSTVVGAVIAIVIVIAVVAIVYVIQKK